MGSWLVRSPGTNPNPTPPVIAGGGNRLGQLTEVEDRAAQPDEDLGRERQIREMQSVEEKRPESKAEKKWPRLEAATNVERRRKAPVTRTRAASPEAVELAEIGVDDVKDLRPFDGMALPDASGVTRGVGEASPNSGGSPNGTYIKDTRPTLRWGHAPGALKYHVFLWNSDDDLVASARVDGLQWEVPIPLATNDSFRWEVHPLGADNVQTAVHSKGAFSTLSEFEREAVELAERGARGSHLKLGAVYVKHGLLDDAERKFRAMAEMHPASELYRRLLERVNELRRGRR